MAWFLHRAPPFPAGKPETHASFAYSGDVGHQVFTKDGLLFAEELGVKHYFQYGRNGLAYRVVQPEVDETGQLPNPYLEVYRFVAP